MASDNKKLASAIQKLCGDVSYLELRAYPRNHSVYATMTSHIKGAQKRRQAKEKLFQIIKRNTGNISLFFNQLPENIKITYPKQNIEVEELDIQGGTSLGTHLTIMPLLENVKSTADMQVDDSFTFDDHLNKTFADRLPSMGTPLKICPANSQLTPLLQKNFQKIESTIDTSTPLKHCVANSIFTHSKVDVLSPIKFSTPTQFRSNTPVKTTSPYNCTAALSPQSILNVTDEVIEIPEELLNLSIGKDLILPQGARNEDPSCHKNTRRSMYKDCIILEGSFAISEPEWNLMFVDGKINTKVYTHLLKNRIKRYVNTTCMLAFYRTVTSIDNVEVRAYCRHNRSGCKNFRIIINRLPAESGERNADVFTTSINFCHPYRLTAQVRGIHRDEMKNQLLKVKPLKSRQKAVASIDRKLLQTAGDLQDVKSEPTVRKIRSNAMNELIRDEDDEIDMIYMQREHPEYIKYVGSPLNIKIFSREQLFVAKYAKDDILHFDATGTVVRLQIKDAPTKMVYYYCGVITTQDTERLCPIFEMISSQHDAYTICDLFQKFKSFCKEEQHRKLFFKIFVTDFSFANINAACLAFHSMRLVQYLQVSFKIAQGNETMSSDFIVIMLCCAHFMKNICEFINKNVDKNASIKNAFKEFVACAFFIKDMQEATQWFGNLIIVLCHKTKDMVFTNAIKQLQNFVRASVDKTVGKKLVADDVEGGLSRSELAESIIGDDKLTQKLKSKRKLRKNSPFYKFFNNIYQQFVTNNGSTSLECDISNEYFCPSFASLILERYVPFLPLWTRLLSRHHKKHVERVSNNPIERFFGLLKNQILENSKNLRPSNFVRESRRNVCMIYRELSLGIKKSGLATAPAIDSHKVPEINFAQGVSDEEDRTSVTSTESNAQERWNRKPKRKAHSYFHARHLKRQLFSEKAEQLSVIEEECSRVTKSLEKRFLEGQPSNVGVEVKSKGSGENLIDDQPLVNSTLSDRGISASGKEKTPTNVSNSLEFFENGLLVDIDFYKSTKQRYIIAKYSFASVASLKSINSLDFQEINCASDCVITPRIVNLVCSMFMAKFNLKRNSIWLVEKARQVIESGEKLSKLPALTKITYMPLHLNDEKWLLLKINVEHKILTVYNPSVSETVTHSQFCEAYLTKLLQFLKMYNLNKQYYTSRKQISETGWKIGPAIDARPHNQLPKTDGLLVLWYLHEFISQTFPNEPADLFAFANSLQMDLLRYADDMRDLCLICAHCAIDKSAKWIQCEICHRWLHENCDKRKFNFTESFSSPKVEYHCFLCCSKFQVECRLKTTLQSPRAFINLDNVNENGSSREAVPSAEKCPSVIEISDGEQSHDPDFSLVNIGYRERLTTFDIDVLLGKVPYFTDSIMNRFGEIWNKHFENEFAKHQDVLTCIAPAMSKYTEKIPQGMKHVQTVFIGSPDQVGHWICVYYDGQRLNIYNSLSSFVIDTTAKTFLDNLYCHNPPLVHHPVQQQTNSYDCGMFAMAFAVSVGLGENPVGRTYDPSKMLKHCWDIIREGVITQFP